MSKIGLHIIAKDEFEKVESIIEKYAKYFDEIIIAADQRLDEFKKLEGGKVKVYPYTWINDFSDKRNFVASKTESPLYFRMDTDDEIENPHIISEIVSAMDERNIDVFYVPYIYAKDEHGNCIAKHWRETIVRKRPDVYWKKTVHENVFMEKQDACIIVRDDRLKIIHNIDAAHADASYQRNIDLLMEEFKKDGVKSDPRTIAYIGRMLMAKGKWKEANLFLENLVRRSGWDDDKYFAWIQMSQCYQQLGQFDTAIGCCNEALGINVKFPDAYLQMGAVYLQKADYEKASTWCAFGIVRPEPDTCFVVDPTFYGYKAHINAALAFLGKGDLQMAIGFFKKAKSMAPNEPYVLEKEKLFFDAMDAEQYITSLKNVIQYTLKTDRSKVKHLIDGMPREIFHDERASAIRNQFITPRTWADNEVAIYCGNAWEDWSPISTLKGIGGSEEAVIYLSNELTKLGYKVTVFNQCGELAGVYEGVDYRNYHEFCIKDNYNVLIGWRMNSIHEIKARKKFVWLHDVPVEGMLTKEGIANIDKIIVLSEFHKSLLPDFIPADKVFVSANGINLSDFLTPTNAVRNPKRMIYTSSYDRGLEHVLRMWPLVRKEIPEAELHIFYGWNTYDEMVKVGRRDTHFKNYMVKLMNQEGITEHGRVGHKKLVREFKQSGVWVYPSHFEEISCISAMKAQAAGCVPVCTDYAALSETVKAGIKVHGRTGDIYESGYGNATSNQESYEASGNVNVIVGEKSIEGKLVADQITVNEIFLKELIAVLKDEQRQEEIRKTVIEHRDEFGWNVVAKNWSEELFQTKKEEVLV